MKQTVVAIALTLAFSVASAANAAGNCTTGIPCGNGCIAEGATCHIKPPVKQCKTGKPCGNTCIKITDHCNRLR